MTTLVHSSVIGGEHEGWNVAVAVSEKSAFPFCTGKLPPAPTVCLFPADGLFWPGFTHATSAVRVTWICGMFPSPATFPEAVKELPEILTVGEPTKWALPASATGTANTAVTAATNRSFIKRDIGSLLEVDRSPNRVT